MLTYFMDARGKQRKYRFLYHAIRRDILAKKLLPGERLPSKRALAEHLGLSLSTVGSAYAALLDEGYLEVKARSGFFVSALAIPESGSVTPAATADFQSADENTTSAPATSETESAVPHASLGAMCCSASRTSSSRAPKTRAYFISARQSAPICSATAACRRSPRRL